jgi:hypothetical protein
MRKKRILFLHSIKIWLLFAVLTICRTASFASCSSNKDNPTGCKGDCCTIRSKHRVCSYLCRASEANRYQSLADIDKPEVRVMVNPGGLNEKYGLVYEQD